MKKMLKAVVLLITFGNTSETTQSFQLYVLGEVTMGRSELGSSAGTPWY